MPKVSIIVPTYNVEKYLEECMESIIHQTLQDIEVICIDDGSKDNSGKILDEYASKDSRIKVIHKENGGYGKAMNVGLDHATGEYIGIVEPDDFVELNMYETLYNKAIENDVDFIKGNYYKYFSNPVIKKEISTSFNKTPIYNKVLNPIEHLEVFSGGPCIWSAIYKVSFLRGKKIRFLETPGASFQDTSFWIKVLFETKKCIFIPEVFNYYRCDNENSSVKSNSKVFCICDEMRELEKIYKKNKLYRKIINALKFEKYLWNYKRLNEEGQHLFKNEIIKLEKNIKKMDFVLLNMGTTNSIKNLLQIIDVRHYSFFESLFSIKDSLNKKHKIITILGIKISIRRKLLHHLFSISNKHSSNGKWHKIIYILGIKISLRNKRKEKRVAIEQEKQFVRDSLNKLVKQVEHLSKQNDEFKSQLQRITLGG